MKAGDRETLVPGRGRANAGLILSQLFSFFRLMQASMLDRGVERGADIAVRVGIGQTLLLGSLNSLSMVGLACSSLGRLTTPSLAGFVPCLPNYYIIISLVVEVLVCLWWH